MTASRLRSAVLQTLGLGACSPTVDGTELGGIARWVWGAHLSHASRTGALSEVQANGMPGPDRCNFWNADVLLREDVGKRRAAQAPARPFWFRLGEATTPPRCMPARPGLLQCRSVFRPLVPS